jgi:hypothetical protein
MYSENTIRITDSNNFETERYTGVQALRTLDVDINTSIFINAVDSHLSGPGPLVISGGCADFQMFLMDPQDSVIPPVLSEEETLREMMKSLLDTFLKPESEQEFSESIVFWALRNLEACNPVLRALARSTLQFLQSNSSNAGQMLENLQNFSMTCSLRQRGLHCTVDKGFAPALDRATYCTINNQTATRQECKPFYGQPVILLSIEEIQSVIVEAINCNGQRAMVTVVQECDK